MKATKTLFLLTSITCIGGLTAVGFALAKTPPPELLIQAVAGASWRNPNGPYPTEGILGIGVGPLQSGFVYLSTNEINGLDSDGDGWNNYIAINPGQIILSGIKNATIVRYDGIDSLKDELMVTVITTSGIAYYTHTEQQRTHNPLRPNDNFDWHDTDGDLWADWIIVGPAE